MILLDMKMPDECALCPISCKASMEADVKSLALNSVKRLVNCPLKELPKGHGDLIDRGETIKTLKSLGNRDYRREKGTIQEAIKMLSSDKYTPTIIEAEADKDAEHDNN